MTTQEEPVFTLSPDQREAAVITAKKAMLKMMILFSDMGLNDGEVITAITNLIAHYAFQIPLDRLDVRAGVVAGLRHIMERVEAGEYHKSGLVGLANVDLTKKGE